MHVEVASRSAFFVLMRAACTVRPRQSREASGPLHFGKESKMSRILNVTECQKSDSFSKRDAADMLGMVVNRIKRIWIGKQGSRWYLYAEVESG
jgi:hypothetical protein